MGFLPLRHLAVLVTIGMVAPAHAGEDPTCEERCAGALDTQSYGVGEDDSVCVAHCTEEEVACGPEWQAFFTCVDDGQGDGSACAVELGDARACSICDHGLVWDEGANVVLFVDDEQCSEEEEGQTHDCSFDTPCCSLEEGMTEAVARQKQGDDVKLMVCEDVYREAFALVLPSSEPPIGSVIVESVRHHGAVMSGSVDRTAQFTLETDRQFSELEHNLLLWSTDLTHPTWGVGGITSVPLAPPLTCPDLDHAGYTCTNLGLAADITTVVSNDTVLYQAGLGLTGLQPTFSIYVLPGTVPKLRLDMVVTGGTETFVDLAMDGGGCDGVTSSDNVRAGVEQVAGTPWLRVWMTPRLDHAATVEDVRVWLDHAHADGGAHIRQAGYTIGLFGPQLDVRPYGEYESTPRTYYPTEATPITATHTRSADVWSAPVIDKAWGLQPTIDSNDIYPLGRRAELVFVDGVSLRQVVAENDLVAGTFRVIDDIDLSTNDYADFGTAPFEDPQDPDDSDNQHIPNSCSPTAPCPVELVAPDGHGAIESIEVADARALFYVTNPWNWEVRGMVFQHATSAWDGVSIEEIPTTLVTPHYNSSGVHYDAAQDFVLVENLHQWNGGQGLSVQKGAKYGHDVALIGNISADNGAGGAFIGGLVAGKLYREQWNRNNWRGELGGFSGAVTTGVKLGGTVDTELTEVVAADNHAHGVWFDYDNRGALLQDSLMIGNAGAGLYLERNDGLPPPVKGGPTTWPTDPTLHVWLNRFESNVTGIAGITTGPVDISENELIGNETAVSWTGDSNTADEAPIHDWTVVANTIAATCDDHDLVAYGSKVHDFDTFAATLTMVDNLYSHPSGESAFAFEVSNSGEQTVTTHDYRHWATCAFYVTPPAQCHLDDGSTW